MSNRRLTIWCDNDFTAEQQPERDLLAEGVGPHRLLMFAPNDDGGDGEAHKALQIAEIAFGAPDARAVCESASVRWVHLNSAGYTSFDDRDIRETLIKRGTILTNSSDAYGEPCAQHLLAMMTSLVRGLPVALDAQRGDRSWRMSLRPTLPLLNDQTVLLLGFGAIARRLRSEEHTSELQSPYDVVCRRLLEKKKSGRPGLRCASCTGDPRGVAPEFALSAAADPRLAPGALLLELRQSRDFGYLSRGEDLADF